MMRSSATENWFTGTRGQTEHRDVADDDDLDLYMQRGAPDWGLVCLLIGYAALIGGGLLLIL